MAKSIGPNNRPQLVKILLIMVLVLLAVSVGAVLFALNQRDSKNTQQGNQASEAPSQEGDNIASSEDARDPRPSEPIQTVKTNNPRLELQLDSIVRRNNNVVVNLSFIHTFSGISRLNNPVYENKLKDAYLVDDATNQKYSVVTDANGDPLVSDIDLEEFFNLSGLDQEIGFFIQLTAPPAGSTVDIYIPGAQAFTSIKLD